MSALKRFLAAVERGDAPTPDDLRAVSAGLKAMQSGASFAKAFGPTKRGRKAKLPLKFTEMFKDTPAAQIYRAEIEAARMYKNLRDEGRSAEEAAATSGEKFGVSDRTIFRYVGKHAQIADAVNKLQRRMRKDIPAIWEIMGKFAITAREGLGKVSTSLQSLMDSFRRKP